MWQRTRDKTPPRRAAFFGTLLVSGPSTLNCTLLIGLRAGRAEFPLLPAPFLPSEDGRHQLLIQLVSSVMVQALIPHTFTSRRTTEFPFENVAFRS